jgi:hypothetical protein
MVAEKQKTEAAKEKLRLQRKEAKREERYSTIVNHQFRKTRGKGSLYSHTGCMNI